MSTQKKRPQWRATQGAPLGPREEQILKLLCEGLSSKQIAHRIGTSHRTVDNQRVAILDKTGCKGLVNLGAWAAKHGYADVDQPANQLQQQGAQCL